MGTVTNIAWCDKTFNPWRGCTKVSPGCQFCYADKLSARNHKTLGIWGRDGTRVVAAESYWKLPIAWNRWANRLGRRYRVFCASLADVFEGPETMPASDWPTIEEARKRLFELICRTPHLDWLLLSKRPQYALDTMVRAGLYAVANPSLPCPQPNIWIGTSAEDQQRADERIPNLLRIPAVVRFLSVEPMLGPIRLLDVDLGGTLWIGGQRGCGATHRGNGGPGCPREPHHHHDNRCRPGIDWIITGHESGGNRRLGEEDWIRSIAKQCETAGTAFFNKQMQINGKVETDVDKFPADLRIQQFPVVAA